MSASLRDALLASPVSPDPIYKIGDDAIHARTLSGLDIASAQDSMPDGDASSKDLLRFTSRLVVIGACTADGSAIFDDANIDAVSKMPFRVLQILAEGIQKYNGMDNAKNSQAPSTVGS